MIDVVYGVWAVGLMRLYGKQIRNNGVLIDWDVVMADKLTPKQERFALLIASGGNVRRHADPWQL